MIQLEVGKTYQVRNPKEVRSLGLKEKIRIVRRSDSGLFVGDDFCYYNLSGACHVGVDKYDLVEEVVP